MLITIMRHLKYFVSLLFIGHIAVAQNKDDWKYYACPNTDIGQMTMIKFGETREDVYLGTAEECALKRAENPDEITCIPLVKDDIINSYLKNKEIYDELHDENELIVNPTVYSATINFKVKYLFKKGESVEPITFYVFHSPEFCRGGWIDIDRNSDGSAFIVSESFENSIYYMSMTTVKKKKDHTFTPQNRSANDTIAKHAQPATPEIAIEYSNGIFSSTNEHDLYQNTRYAIDGSTATATDFTNNFIRQTNERIPQIMQGSYCVTTDNPDVMVFYWAYKDELKFSIFKNSPGSGRKDKRDAMNALIKANVSETDKCNIKKD